MSKVQVKITSEEALQAAIIGLKRRIVSVDKCLFDNKRVDSAWETDVEGAISEFVAAKFLGIEWQAGINTFHAPDVGLIQVRTTQRTDGKLIVRNDDSDDEAFVLVTGTYPNYFICGWLLGKEAKKEKWIYNPNNKGAAWFVPQEALHDIHSLNQKEKKADEDFDEFLS